MATDDDWRAQRAAQLAGTPFARPSSATRDRIDDTLPIGRTEPRVSLQPIEPRESSPTAGSSPPVSAPTPRGTKWWLPVAVMAAVVVAAAVWLLGGQKRAQSPIEVSAISAPTVASAPVIVSPPAATPAPPTAPPTVAPPAAELALTSTVATPGPVATDPTTVPIEARHVGARVASIAATSPRQAPVVRQHTPHATVRAASRPMPQRPTAAPVLPVVTITVPACAPRRGRLEAAICASPTLTALDREMRQLSAGVVADGDQRLIAKMQKGEASFSKKRDRCKDEKCLGKAYSHRIGALQKLHKKAVVAEARAREMTLPICDKGVTPSSTTCRPAHRRFSFKRLFGG